MNRKMWVGLLLLAGSYAQLLVPRRLFTEPTVYFYGYPFVPGNLLAVTATLFTLGVVVLSEGVCQRLGAPSLWRLVTRDWRIFVRIIMAAAAAGLVMELFAQWLAKLWVYPYWTLWFYGLVLLPGFVFYWISIVESYLAVKAVLDASARLGSRPVGRRLGPTGNNVVGALGGFSLVVVLWLYAVWYAAHGGYVFTATVPTRHAPPFGYVLLAFLGVWLVAEWALHRRGLPSPAGVVLRGYWAPVTAAAGSSLLLSLVMETQNAVNQYWSYTHFPGTGVRFIGVQASVLATWPLQVLAFLLVPSVFVPALARLFWRRCGSLTRSRRDATVSRAVQPNLVLWEVPMATVASLADRYRGAWPR
jgi:hypothetical protein